MRRLAHAPPTPSRPLGLDAWLHDGGPTAAWLADDADRTLARLAIAAPEIQLDAVIEVRGSTPVELFGAIANLVEGPALSDARDEEARALATRLTRALRTLPTDGRPTPRRRRGVEMLASRLLLRLVGTRRVVLIVDLRDMGDAGAMAGALASPWTADAARAFRARRSDPGRIGFVLGGEHALPLDLVQPSEAARGPSLLDFVSRNLESVAEVAWSRLSADARGLWALAAALDRPLRPEEAPALLGTGRPESHAAIDALAQMGVVEMRDTTLHRNRSLPAPPLDAQVSDDAAHALLARLQFGREAGTALDVLALAPERLEAEGSLALVIAEAIGDLRAGWRHDAALRLAERTWDHVGCALEGCRTLLDLGRDDEAAARLSALPTDDLCREKGRFAALVSDAIDGQSSGVIAACAASAHLLDLDRRHALEGQVALDQGDALRALETPAGGGEWSTLVRVRALLSARRVDEAGDAIAALDGCDLAAPARARLQHNLALVHLGRGAYGEAVQHLRRSVTLFDERALELEAAVALGNLGIALEFVGSYDEARRCFEESLSRHAGRITFHGAVRTLLALADLQITLARFDEARGTLDRAQRTAEKGSLDSLAADAMVRSAHLHLREGLLDAAAGLATRARTDAPELDAEHRARLRTVEILCDVLAGVDMADDVELEEATLRLETRRALDFARAWTWARSEPLRAEATACALVAQADECDDAALRWEARSLRAAALGRLGRPAEARQVAREAARLRDAIAGGLPESDRGAYADQPWHRWLMDQAQRTPVEAPPTKTTRERTPRYAPTRSTGRLVGTDPGLLEAVALAERFARSGAAVLITGESGTGKELVAELIHRWSDRASEPLVRVNAAALADTLLLSELFGHERGAFTGAARRKVGKFEAAGGGTLFLDEIGDISDAAQAALLRVLQDGTFHRVGGTELVRSRARVVVATNRNLEERVAEGRFRLDLFYRISSLSLELPALRDRTGDLRALCTSLLSDLCGDEEPPTLDEGAHALLARHDWPGNVRELKNVLERMLHLREGSRITAALVRAWGPTSQASEAATPTTQAPLAPNVALGPGFSLKSARRQLEVDLIARALDQADGNIAAAARLLGMSRPMLSRKIKEYGLKEGPGSRTKS